MSKFIKVHTAKHGITMYIRADQIYIVETMCEPIYEWSIKGKKEIFGTTIRTLKHEGGACYVVKESIDEIMVQIEKANSI